MNKVIFSVFAVLFLLTQCDVVKDPYPPSKNVVTEGIQFDTVYSEHNTTIRKVLIEEFTGHKCTNCPDGAKEVARLDSVYADTIIPVAIHAGFFASPEPQGSGMYEEDFTTDLGNAYNNFFSVAAYPSGMVSRIKVNGNFVLTKSQWETVVQQIKNDAPLAQIDITNLYNDSVRTLKSFVNIKWLQAGTSSYKLQVYFIEDNIIAWQKVGPNDVPNYRHRHVYRESFNGIWGTDIPNINQGDTLHEEYAINVNTAYKSNDCIVVAIIYDSNSYEIMQAAEAYIIQH